VKPILPARKLPASPDLDRLKHLSKDFLASLRANDPDTLREAQYYYPSLTHADFALHHAQLILARSYGFESWPKLKAYVEGVTITRLIEAVRAGKIRQVTALLQKRPELVNRSAPNDNGKTPLHYAVIGRMPDMARVLMKFGADPRAGEAGVYALRQAACPLSIATERGYDELAAILHEERPRPSTPPDQTPTQVPADPLRTAVIHGDAIYLRAKAKEEDIVTPRDQNGWLLRVAVDHNQPSILKLLLDLGLDPDARVRVVWSDRPEFTFGMPLYECARNGKHEMAEILLSRGADPNGAVYASGTPLSEAYGQADDRMVALLERYGGKSNASMAGLYRRPDLAAKLLEEYGDTPLPDDGFSSGPVAQQLLGAAARGGDSTILRMAMARVDIPYGDAKWNGLLEAPLGFFNHWIGPWCHPEWDRTTYLACFRMILEKSGPPNLPLKAGATILHLIVVMGDHVTDDERLAFATAALDAGARLDLRDELLNSTPLGWACRWGRENLVRLFLERGADPFESDAEPWATPRAWAAKKKHLGVLAILEG
jgi:ankyrin repeat protein